MSLVFRQCRLLLFQKTDFEKSTRVCDIKRCGSWRGFAATHSNCWSSAQLLLTDYATFVLKIHLGVEGLTLHLLVNSSGDSLTGLGCARHSLGL